MMAADDSAPAAAKSAPNAVQRVIARAQKLHAVRMFLRYQKHRGPILANGLSYQSLFAVFAALWLGFSVAGLVLRENPELRAAFFATINASVPGLIDTGSGTGAVKAEQLLQTSILGWSGIIAAIGLLITGLGWLASARDAVRALFDLPGEHTNYLLLKLKDFGLALGFAAALLVSAALSLVSTQALEVVLGWLGIEEESPVTSIVGRGVSLVLMLALDTAVLAALYRLLSGLSIPPRRLFAGAVLGAIALGVLKVLGNALLGGASRNPLLASFAVIIGLLIWFNLVCQVILLTASWIATGMADDGIIADPEVEARREAERVAAQRAEAEAAAATARAHTGGWWSRLLRRRSRRRSVATFGPAALTVPAPVRGLPAPRPPGGPPGDPDHPAARAPVGKLDGMPPLRIATINTNGIRAAYRKGMGAWLEARGVDILAIQEVRASTDDLANLLGPQWDILHDPATAKGRAGVALASRAGAHGGGASVHRVDLGAPEFDSAGRWLEADYEVGGSVVTVVSTYVHSGEDGTPKQVEKYKFLDAMTARLPELAAHSELAVVLGDLNVGHRELDIRNWKGNRKNAGFLPEERAYFDRFFGPAGEPVTGVDGSVGTGLGWVDVGRRWAGEVDGPYTWWSWRGKAFDNDTGWRLDYQVATPALAGRVTDYRVDRAESWDQRWSDHTPVVVDYAI